MVFHTSCRNSSEVSHELCPKDSSTIKPIVAFGSAINTSPSIAQEAVTPPVVGLVKTTI